MINAITWQNILHLSTNPSLFGKLFTDVYPVVVSSCLDMNKKLKQYYNERVNYIEISKGYLKSEERRSDIILVDTIRQDSNGFRCIPSYEVFTNNLNRFYEFIEKTFSPTMDPYKYISDVIAFRETLFNGNVNVTKPSNILSNPDDLNKYFNYLSSEVNVYFIKDLAPNFPKLDRYDGRRIYPKMIRMISDYMCKKELLGFFIRLFDVTAKKDIYTSTEELNLYEEYDNEMALSLEDICDESMIYMSLEAMEEEGEKNGFFKFFEKLKNRIQSIPAQLATIKKKAELFMQKRKNIRLYKRVLGKIPSLYKRYADQTEIDENQMKGDPVEILTTKATTYIINLGKHVGEISDQLMNMMNAIASANTYDVVKNNVEKWIEDSPMKTKDGELSELKDKLAERMRKATRAKLVECLVADNDIYGYTPDSMVLKKFPPPNHTIVSLFVENPFERPHIQKVSDIFTSPEAFEIMANSDKRKIFSVSELQNAVLKNKINAETFKEIERKRKEILKKIKGGHAAGFVKSEDEDDSDQKENEKMLKAAMKGCKLSVKEVAKMKVYVMECINVYFSMIIRIDNLCLASLNAMLEVEKKASDNKYGMGQGDALHGSGSKYDLREAGRNARAVQKRQKTYNDNYGNDE